MSSSIKVCISQDVSGIKWTYPLTNNKRKSNYIEDPKIAKGGNHSKHLHKGEKQSRRSKTRVLNKMKKLPNIHALLRSAQIWNPHSPKII